jgi:hypothetical protein
MNEQPAIAKAVPFGNPCDGSPHKFRRQQEVDHGHADLYHRDQVDSEVPTLSMENAYLYASNITIIIQDSLSL